MTRTRRVVLAVLCCAILLSSLCSVQDTYNQKVGGSYSSVTALTPRCRAWFAETFGQCESLVGLLVCVNLFACRNFRYTPQEDFLVQNFDCHKFLFDKPFEGVCFEFACFVKCAVLVWAELQGRSDIRCYVYSVELAEGGYHAVNMIHEGDTIYYLDATTNSTLTREGKASPGVRMLLTTPEEFFENRGARVYDIN